MPNVPATHGQNLVRLAVASIAIALGVMALKFLAWRLTGSVALLSDALESVVNVLAAGAALVAVRVSHLPADASHPFGHHKAEYFSAVLEGALIIVAALLIAQASFAALREPRPIAGLDVGLVVNAGAAVLNAGWAAVLLRAGARARSPALVADGKHLLTDVATSVGVIAGLLAANATGLPVLDPLLALLVGLNILWQGWKLVNQSVQGLMDAGAEPAELFLIREIVSAQAHGALEVHDLRTRVAGRATFIEFHLVVDSAMSVGEAHAICDRIEDALQAEIPGARVVIHVEPDAEAKLPPGAGAVPFA